jgi:hypothetical protein
MLRLPNRIDIQLAEANGKPVRRSDVLIAIDFLVDGRYYARELAGLTGENGSLSVSSADLERRFRAKRLESPMDLKLDLEECDQTIEIRALSATDVANAIRALAVWKNSPVKDLYLRAQNRDIPGAVKRIVTDANKTESLDVSLVITDPGSA